MKIVINRRYGRFGISKSAAEKLGISQYAFSGVSRTDERLVALVEENSKDASDSFAKLCVVEIPEEATDWRIVEYDGMEYVLYVVNGKIEEA